ncbi:MAG TPA: methyltransferase domain-containing protein [Methylomirabilota bacterium]|nr:methyltransferase domain-containing protein [Methylomirabilota bacterium]
MENAKSTETEAEEIKFFDKYYENEAYNPLGWRLRLRREVRSLRRTMREGTLGRVLSLGCGDGQFELMLAPWAKQVVGLDISPQGIAVAKRNAAREGIKNVEFRCLPFSELRWDDRFDTIICLAFLHHVPETELSGLLKQCFAHLTPGGIFYSQDPNRNGALRKLGRVVMGADYNKYHSPDERELDPRELSGQLTASGFSQVMIRHIDLTLIPALFLLAKRVSWPLYFCAGIDALWCRSPLAPWSSGFVAVAHKSSAGNNS